MTGNKRPKNSRHRGSHTHGGGAMKKRRGAGNRGGRGMAGTGKRGDAKKPGVWKNTKYFGKTGFTPIRQKKIISINLSDVSYNIESYVAKGVAEKKGTEYTIDLKKIGVQKLLGSGSINKKIVIHVESASEKAVTKTEAAGGKIVLANNEQ